MEDLFVAIATRVQFCHYLLTAIQLGLKHIYRLQYVLYYTLVFQRATEFETTEEEKEIDLDFIERALERYEERLRSTETIEADYHVATGGEKLIQEALTVRDAKFKMKIRIKHLFVTIVFIKKLFFLKEQFYTCVFFFNFLFFFFFFDCENYYHSLLTFTLFRCTCNISVMPLFTQMMEGCVYHHTMNRWFFTLLKQQINYNFIEG